MFILIFIKILLFGQTLVYLYICYVMQFWMHLSLRDALFDSWTIETLCYSMEHADQHPHQKTSCILPIRGTTRRLCLTRSLCTTSHPRFPENRPTFLKPKWEMWILMYMYPWTTRVGDISNALV